MKSSIFGTLTTTLGLLAAVPGLAGSIDVRTVPVKEISTQKLRIFDSVYMSENDGAQIKLAGPSLRPLFDVLPTPPLSDENPPSPTRYLYIIQKEGNAIEIMCSVGSYEYREGRLETKLTPIPGNLGTRCVFSVFKPAGEFKTYREDHEVDFSKTSPIAVEVLTPQYINATRFWPRGGSVSFSGGEAIKILKILPIVTEYLPNGTSRKTRLLQFKNGKEAVTFGCRYLLPSLSARCTIEHIVPRD
jgi:hypothetical protein